MKKSILFSVLLLMLSTSLFGQQIDKARLDSLFDRLAAGNKAMGSLALSKNGVLLYSRAIGRVGTAGGQVLPSNTETRYRIGSITKMFTTVMIFQLIEEGKLSLDLTLDKYYPGITHASAITIGQMLQHRSGIHNFTNDPAYEQYMTHPKGEAEMVEIITKAGSDFTPGEKMAYSNSNFVLLGYILERVTGKSYGDNLKERILSKVGMKSTSMGAKTVPGHNEAFSYQYEGEWKQMPETDMSIPGGAGAIVSTPTDLVRFAQALFAGKLISPSSLDRMKTIRDGIGMGLFQIPFYERKAFGHNGGIDGFVSNLAYFEADGVAIAYCSNGINYPMNDILIGVLSICFGKPYQLPDFSKKPMVVDNLEPYKGVYASKQLPLKLTIASQGNQLTAQGTGQPAFPLEPSDKHTFRFDKAGVVIVFDPDKGTLTLKQGGGEFLFEREK